MQGNSRKQWMEHLAIWLREQAELSSAKCTSEAQAQALADLIAAKFQFRQAPPVDSVTDIRPQAGLCHHQFLRQASNDVFMTAGMWKASHNSTAVWIVVCSSFCMLTAC